VPLLEVAGKLHGGRVPPICSGLRDMVATAISVHLSLITLQENEVTKRLAADAGPVAVPTMVAGVYGMNFANMPELAGEHSYFAFFGVTVIVVGITYVILKKAKWL
jgi:magnesium transporter